MYSVRKINNYSAVCIFTDSDAIFNSVGLKVSLCFSKILCVIICHLFKGRIPCVAGTGMHHSDRSCFKKGVTAQLWGGSLDTAPRSSLSTHHSFCTEGPALGVAHRRWGSMLVTQGPAPFHPRWDSSTRQSSFPVGQRHTFSGLRHCRWFPLPTFASFYSFSQRWLPIKPLVPLISPQCLPLRESNWYTLTRT